MSKVGMFAVRKQNQITDEWILYLNKHNIKDPQQPLPVVYHEYSSIRFININDEGWREEYFDYFQPKITSHLPEWL
jgi:capsule polysaccharide export protein KpsE/RkpR